jgi:trehalose 6-phosphate synthase
MLLPLMLRTLIEGSSLQGAQSRRELEHVRHGVDGTSFLQGSEDLAPPAGDSRRGGAAVDEKGSGKGTADGKSSRGAIKIGFFLHTPFPSSEIYR